MARKPFNRVSDFLATLTDRALGVVLRHGVRGSSVAVEVALWRGLRRAYRRHVRRNGTARGVLSALAAAAYRVALDHRPAGSFLDLELGLWRAFRAPAALAA